MSRRTSKYIIFKTPKVNSIVEPGGRYAATTEPSASYWISPNRLQLCTDAAQRVIVGHARTCCDLLLPLINVTTITTSKRCIAVRKVATPLRELTCHTGSHSVTCHPADVTFPPLPQPKLRYSIKLSWPSWLFSYRDGIAAWRRSPI